MRNRQTGLSLIELVVAISLLAVVVTAAQMVFSKMTKGALRAQENLRDMQGVATEIDKILSTLQNPQFRNVIAAKTENLSLLSCTETDDSQPCNAKLNGVAQRFPVTLYNTGVEKNGGIAPRRRMTGPPGQPALYTEKGLLCAENSPTNSRQCPLAVSSEFIATCPGDTAACDHAAYLTFTVTFNRLFCGGENNQPTRPCNPAQFPGDATKMLTSQRSKVVTLEVEKSPFVTGLLTRTVECLFCHMTVHGDVAGIQFSGSPGSDTTTPANMLPLRGVKIFGNFYSTNHIPDYLNHPQVANGFFPNYKNVPEKVFPRDFLNFPVLTPAFLRPRMSGYVRGMLWQGQTFAPNSPMTLSTIVNNGSGNTNVVLDGTVRPIEIKGEVYIDGDVVIRGFYKGQGTIYAKNIFIPGNLYAVNPPAHSPDRTDGLLAPTEGSSPTTGWFSDTRSRALLEAKKAVEENRDALRLGALNQILVGDWDQISVNRLVDWSDPARPKPINVTSPTGNVLNAYYLLEFNPEVPVTFKEHYIPSWISRTSYENLGLNIETYRVSLLRCAFTPPGQPCCRWPEGGGCKAGHTVTGSGWQRNLFGACGILNATNTGMTGYNTACGGIQKHGFTLPTNSYVTTVPILETADPSSQALFFDNPPGALIPQYYFFEVPPFPGAEAYQSRTAQALRAFAPTAFFFPRIYNAPIQPNENTLYHKEWKSLSTATLYYTNPPKKWANPNVAPSERFPPLGQGYGRYDIDVSRIDAYLFANEQVIWMNFLSWVLNGGISAPRLMLTSQSQVWDTRGFCQPTYDLAATRALYKLPNLGAGVLFNANPFGPVACPDYAYSPSRTNAQNETRPFPVLNPITNLPTSTNTINYDWRLKVGGAGFESLRTYFE